MIGSCMLVSCADTQGGLIYSPRLVTVAGKALTLSCEANIRL